MLRRRVAAVLGSVARLEARPARPIRFLHLSSRRPPAWLLLPIGLDRGWAGSRGRRLSRGVMSDVLWGQYALFLCIRIQDDLLDRHSDDLRWIFLADRFLLESLESFQRCTALGRGFWSFYRACVRETVDGILKVRRLEGRPGVFRAGHLDLHAGVSAIFKLGAAAVCHLHGRTREARWLGTFQDRHAVMSQILDDLEDLPQDLEDGRFTWVANTLLAARPGERMPIRLQARRLADGLVRPERVAAVVDCLRRAADAAAAAVPGSAPPTARTLAGALHARAGAAERRLHEARVAWALGGAMGLGQGQPSN